MYDTVVLTLILLVEVYDVYLNHKRFERARLQRKFRKLLHRVGLR